MRRPTSSSNSNMSRNISVKKKKILSKNEKQSLNLIKKILKNQLINKEVHEGRPAARMLPIRVRSFSAFSTSFSSIFKNTYRHKESRKHKLGLRRSGDSGVDAKHGAADCRLPDPTPLPWWVEPLWPSLMQRFLCSPGGCRGTNTRPDPPQTPAVAHTNGCTPRGAGIDP